MKVAIMGAGLAGLACAIRLERYGITPWVFEKRSEVGDRFVNGEILLSVFSRPIEDEIAFLAEKYGIYLYPTGNLKEFIVSSVHERSVLSGPLGFNNVRGRHEDSFEKQLQRQLKARIHFNSTFKYEQLIKEFTHVVVATGDAADSQAIQTFALDTTATLKGALVQGTFSRHSTRAWFDSRFAPHGYGYLIPLSEHQANIVIAYPELHAADAYPRKELFERFRDRVCHDLGQDLPQTDEFEITGYAMGLAQSARIGNTLFVGNCLGTLMPLMGFGQFPAILSGLYAADDIAGLSRYEDTTRALRRGHRNSTVLRRMFERLTDADLDRAVSLMGQPWANRLFTTEVDVLKWTSYAVRLWRAIQAARPKPL